METLESLDGGERTPIDRVNVPDGNGTQYTTQAVSKQPNRDGTQDDGGGTQGQIVEEVLRREDGDASGSVGGGRGGDCAHCMLFQIPRPVVEEGDEPDPSWGLSLASSLPPSSLEFIAAGEEVGPCLADKVGNEDDKGSRDGDGSRFKLGTVEPGVDVQTIQAHMALTE